LPGGLREGCGQGKRKKGGGCYETTLKYVQLNIWTKGVKKIETGSVSYEGVPDRGRTTGVKGGVAAEKKNKWIAAREKLFGQKN